MKNEKKITNKKIKKETDTEMLARIVMAGFERVEAQMVTKEEFKQGQEKLKQELRQEFQHGQEGLRQEIVSVKEEQKETNRTLVSMKRKQEGTLTSLDETIHRSEFNKLVHRVDALEA